MLSLQNINKTYLSGKKNETVALKDVSLEIGDNEFVSIVGRSGAGKSTLLHIISCIENFDSGTFLIDGERTSGKSDRHQSKLRNKYFGIVLQDFALIDEFNLLENVCVPLHFAGIPHKKRAQMAIDALKTVGMEKSALKYANQISGGQKQRVAIARAIVNNPHYILADEPTGALDTVTSREIMNLFIELHQTGRTVIIVTHDTKVAELCHRNIELSDGEILSDTIVRPEVLL